MSSGCPICGFDGRQVSPSDAAVAMRSFPRRFGSALARPDDDEDRPDDVLHRRPRDGSASAIEHAAWVATGLDQVDVAFRAVMYRTDPEVKLPPLDVQLPVEGGDAPPAAVVAAIKAAGAGVATAIEDAPGDGWGRTGRRPDGAVDALEVVRFGVHLGVHHLRLIERAITAVVHDLG